MCLCMPNLDLDFANVRSLEVRPAMHSCILKHPQDGFRASSETLQTYTDLYHSVFLRSRNLLAPFFSLFRKFTTWGGRGVTEKKQPNPQQFIKWLEQLQKNYKITRENLLLLKSLLTLSCVRERGSRTEIKNQNKGCRIIAKREVSIAGQKGC